MVQGSLLYIRHASESVSNAGVRIRTIKLTSTQKAVRFTIKNVNTFSCICLILFVFRFLFQTPHFLLKCLKREKILLSLKLLRIMIWVRFYDRSLLKELLSGKWFLQICVTSDFFFFYKNGKQISHVIIKTIFLTIIRNSESSYYTKYLWKCCVDESQSTGNAAGPHA